MSESEEGPLPEETRPPEEPLGRFQFGLSWLFVLTFLVAVVCSVGVSFGLAAAIISAFLLAWVTASVVCKWYYEPFSWWGGLVLVGLLRPQPIDAAPDGPEEGNVVDGNDLVATLQRTPRGGFQHLLNDGRPPDPGGDEGMDVAAFGRAQARHGEDDGQEGPGHRKDGGSSAKTARRRRVHSAPGTPRNSRGAGRALSKKCGGEADQRSV
jgi:hypothetical protein